MDENKWKKNLSKMGGDYSDRGPGALSGYVYDPNDLLLPTGAGNLDYLNDCKKILDVGCGVPHALNELKKKGKEVVGITLHHEEVDEAKKRLGFTDNEIITGDMHELPFDNNTFDGAILWDALEHSLSPMIVLWEINRVLKVGGKLVIYIPPQDLVNFPNHVIVPTQLQMRGLLSRACFKIEELKQIETSGILLDAQNDYLRYWAKKEIDLPPFTTQYEVSYIFAKNNLKGWHPTE